MIDSNVDSETANLWQTAMERNNISEFCVYDRDRVTEDQYDVKEIDIDDLLKRRTQFEWRRSRILCNSINQTLQRSRLMQRAAAIASNPNELTNYVSCLVVFHHVCRSSGIDPNVITKLALGILKDKHQYGERLMIVAGRNVAFPSTSNRLTTAEKKEIRNTRHMKIMLGILGMLASVSFGFMIAVKLSHLG